VPEDIVQEAQAARESMLEALADHDDEIMEKYLSGEQPDEKKIKQAVRKVTIEEKVVPVLCGSALKNKGIQTLIDAVIDYLPSPMEVRPVMAHAKKTGQEVLVHPDPKG